MIQRREVLSLATIASLAAIGGSFASYADAESRDGLDGVWEGVLTPVHGQGLNEDSPPQRWRFKMKGNSAQVFILRDGTPLEVKPGKFQLQRNATNALISAVDSGRDADGVWIETEAFLILQKTPEVLGVLFSGAVSNTSLPLDDTLSRFFRVASGDFRRLA